VPAVPTTISWTTKPGIDEYRPGGAETGVEIKASKQELRRQERVNSQANDLRPQSKKAEKDFWVRLSSNDMQLKTANKGEYLKCPKWGTPEVASRQGSLTGKGKRGCFRECDQAGSW